MQKPVRFYSSTFSYLILIIFNGLKPQPPTGPVIKGIILVDGGFELAGYISPITIVLNLKKNL